MPKVKKRVLCLPSEDTGGHLSHIHIRIERIDGYKVVRNKSFDIFVNGYMVQWTAKNKEAADALETIFDKLLV